MPAIDFDRAAEVTKALEERLVHSIEAAPGCSRRTVLGALGVTGSAAIGLGGTSNSAKAASDDGDEHGNFGVVDEYRNRAFDPHEYLRTFNTGDGEQRSVSQRRYEEAGRTVREFELVAIDTTITIAPGVEFPAWAFNGQVPGPTIRAVEGDLLRITFRNASRHAHTIHPHLKNLNPAMDGIPQNGPGVLDTGDSFTYEWIAQPAGTHFYHCHSLPLKEHIHRGLYGTIVVDPD
ncbi:MAG: multicopper oxidase domain-containing protein, partial [archaeon]